MRELLPSETRLKALDLFCGAGGASMGLSRAGYDVTGVDIKPQPRYPFKFVQADAMTFPLAGFDFIWASPPCQAFTKAQRIQANDHPELITGTRDRLKASGAAWTIENVPGAPLIDPIELCGAMFGLRTYRHRLFESSFAVQAPPHPEHVAPLRKMGRPVREGEFIHVVGNFSGVSVARKAMGIDWMMRDELREAIPPIYSEYIARFIR
jgi:DNA (cytosine-5)-methyltransferase 1